MLGVQGTIVFEQDPGDTNSRVTVRLSGLRDGPNPWHIHEHALTDGLPHDCAKAGDHFEVGEGQPSRWDMGTMKPQRGVPYTEDGVTKSGANVSLSGPHSIVGRSVVIHKAKKGTLTAQRWVCANIEYVDPPVAAWAVFNMDGVEGSIQLTQGTNGSDPTQIAVDLVGLKAGPNPWHVHEKSVHGNACDESSTGGHFGPSTVWDLGTKHGDLDGGDSGAVNRHFAEATWAGLPLFGPDSVVGKSIVIHKANNDRWVCATINQRPACRDDPSWQSGGVTCAVISARGPLACLMQDSHLRMTSCPRSCGYCPDEVSDSATAHSLQPDAIPRPSIIDKGQDNWFHFTGVAGTSYEIVATVIPGASNLQDSVLELYSQDPTETLLQQNDDAQTGRPGDDPKGKDDTARGDRGSKISWACDTNGEYWVRVRGFNQQDHGYYTVRITTVDQADSCDDGVQGVGEEGVDCGGSCQPCHISIILGFKNSQTNAGDLTSVDENADGVPDFFQSLEFDVKSALGNKTWTRVEVKDVQTTPHGLNVNMFLEAPPGFYPYMEPGHVVDELRKQILNSGSNLRSRQPDLTSVSRGVLCAAAGIGTSAPADAKPYLCGFGSCHKGTAVGSGALCDCESDYTGPHCHQRVVHTEETAPPKNTWVYPAVGCVVLGLVVIACWQRNRVEKRKYNQSVFEMLQAPETFAGPSTGFVKTKTTPGGLLRTASQGQGQSGGMTPQQLNYDASTAYTPNQSYVTGGF
jgi:Cu/Zn superoxide dismutase